jgi:hypothetical protein
LGGFSARGPAAERLRLGNNAERLRLGNDAESAREGAVIVVVRWGGLSSPDRVASKGKKTVRDGDVGIRKKGLPFWGTFPRLLSLLGDAGRGAVLAVLVGCGFANAGKQVSNSQKKINEALTLFS